MVRVPEERTLDRIKIMTRADAFSLKGVEVLWELEKSCLRFLGYKAIECKNGVLLAEADTSMAGSFCWWRLVRRPHGVCFMRWLKVADSASLVDQLLLANAINKMTEMSGTSAGTPSSEIKEDTSVLFTTALLEGDYDQQSFSSFVERLNREYLAALAHDEFIGICRRIQPCCA